MHAPHWALCTHALGPMHDKSPHGHSWKLTHPGCRVRLSADLKWLCSPAMSKRTNSSIDSAALTAASSLQHTMHSILATHIFIYGSKDTRCIFWQGAIKSGHNFSEMQQPNWRQHNLGVELRYDTTAHSSFKNTAPLCVLKNVKKIVRNMAK